MLQIMSISTLSKGTFDIMPAVKLKNGSLCSLRRNPENDHGGYSDFCTKFIDFASVMIWYRHVIFMVTDFNCIQILAPIDGGTSNGNTYISLQRVGNLDRKCAAILSPLMDRGFTRIIDTGNNSPHEIGRPPDNTAYGEGFSFLCLLSSCASNRSKKGFVVEIVIQSNNSALWVQCLANYLSDNDFPPKILINI